MTIASVKDASAIYEVTLADGTLIWVPKDPENADYVHVETWIAAGGNVTT